ncbi:MAG: 3'-5' exonuclease [Cyanobacteria bacterium P01_A01_bin.17]
MTSGKASDIFAAIDFETADRGADSACSVAIVRANSHQIIDSKYWLIQPPRRQFEFNHIHGLSWIDVQDQPTFAQLWPQLYEQLKGVNFIAAHNASFDRRVLLTCCQSAQITPPHWTFQCTVKLARQVWKIYPTKLPNVCAALNIPLQHHNALSDAEACAKIVIAAAR